jgi:hypothetical protein
MQNGPNKINKLNVKHLKYISPSRLCYILAVEQECGQALTLPEVKLSRKGRNSSYGNGADQL